MSSRPEGDYVLGTGDEEVRRLQLQHTVWRPMMLDCWQRAGIGSGARVLDLGAGPGYATFELAEIVGPTGEVVALERSQHFVEVLTNRIRERGLANIKVEQRDLATDDLPDGPFDFAWCRWVAMFIPDRARLISKLSAALRPGGRVMFHEYAAYATWRFSPRLPAQEEFTRKIEESWRASGGDPDVALQLPPLLVDSGFTIKSTKPLIFSLRPTDEAWQWPATFIRSGRARLEELGFADREFATRLEREYAGIESNPNAIVLTPLVLEIIAEKKL